MASAFDRIFADVRKDIPSVADAVLRQELFRVLDDFCQTTNIFQEEVTINVVANTGSYTFTTAEGSAPNRLLFVYDANAPTKYWPMGGITMRHPGIIVLPRIPINDATWKAIVAKRTVEPLSVDKYPQIDDWIVDKYADCIGRGILARLQWEPMKPYSNPMLAGVNQKAYIAGRSLARVNDGFGNVYDAATWRFPQGWGSIQKKAYS